MTGYVNGMAARQIMARFAAAAEASLRLTVRLTVRWSSIAVVTTSTSRSNSFRGSVFSPAEANRAGRPSGKRAIRSSGRRVARTRAATFFTDPCGHVIACASSGASPERYVALR